MPMQVITTALSTYNLKFSNDPSHEGTTFPLCPTAFAPAALFLADVQTHNNSPISAFPLRFRLGNSAPTVPAH